MNASQSEKAVRFKQLHERAEPFYIPNPWDAGTAKLLASLGFEALATTSLGLANSLGRAVGTGAVTPEEVLENCRTISEASDLPVNADFEGGYADDPAGVAKNVTRCCATGVAGLSIEDSTGNKDKPL